MKKLYTLLVAVLVAVTATAQVSVKDFSARQNSQVPFKGVQKELRGEPGAGWVYFSDYDAAFWGEEALTAGGNYYFAMDSMGLVTYSDGDAGHPFMHSAGQTYDFNSYFYDEVAGEGEVSFSGTQVLNIDSIYIQSMYFRHENVPAGTMDTLIVGVFTAEEANGYQFTDYPNTCFWGLDYNPNTGAQWDASTNTYATVFKFPIGDADVSQPVPDEEGYYYYATFEFPINVPNVSNKAIHVAYTFKRGYDIGLNDTLPSTFTLCTWESCDPLYYITNDDYLRCDNRSHGDYILTFSDGDMSDFYYPGFALQSAHFPRMAVKFSCNDCSLVNVPEIEKTNPTVYPNPATNNFTVNLGNDEKANIQLFNIVGQQVYAETITGTAQVNVANLHSGVYMLKVNQNGKVFTTKVVVK